MPRAKFQTLTEQMFYVLLCLKNECYGMDILDRVPAMTANRVSVGSGTLYNLLEQFLAEGFIRETKVEGRRRSYILTEKGRELLEFAKQIRYLTDEFGQSFASDHEISGFLRIVTPDSVCEDMINSNYVDFHSKYPKISLKFTTADTEEMFSMLNHNKADLMLTLDKHVYHRDYIIAHEQPIKMNFVTGAGSPYAIDRPLSLSEVAKFPLILTEGGLGYRHVLDEELAKRSLEVLPILEIGRTDIITSMLEAGVGVSFLPDFVTKELMMEGKLAYLDVTDMNVDIWKQLIYHKNKWMSKSLKVFIDYITEKEFTN